MHAPGGYHARIESRELGGPEVGFGLLLHLPLLTKAAVADQPFVDVCGQKFHGALRSLEVFSKTRRDEAGRTRRGVIQDSVRFREAPPKGNPKRKNL